MESAPEKLIELIEQQNLLIEGLSSGINELQKELKSQNSQLEQIRYSAAHQMQSEYYRRVTANQFDFLGTINDVADNRKSLARFGDGELALTAHPYRDIPFQKGSNALTAKLQGVLNTQRDGLLVALPSTVIDVYWMTSISRYWPILREIIPQDRRWGFAMVSRAYAFRVEGQKLVEAWRRCWEGRDVTVVTGEGSRFYESPVFFDNVKSIDFVYGQPRNAFEGLESLKSELLSRELDIVLIALGPAGTVLAAELHDNGIQALDIGHLTASYDEAFNGGVKPENMPISKK